MSHLVTRIAGCLLCAGVLMAQGISLDDDTIGYRQTAPRDAVALLQDRLNDGSAHLDFEDAHGYLVSVLKNLKVPVSSQTLVFSKTSFQQQLISPEAPRALYYNDDVYVGWVRGGEVLEIASVDPGQGTMFYTLEQRKAERPQFARREECLECHDSPKTEEVPGLFLRSVYPDASGFPQLQAGSYDIDDSSPFGQRWGGWYVTGTHGAQRHMGNVWVRDPAHPDKLDQEAGANVTSLKGRFETGAYLTPHSDLVALMVLEHQTRMHTLLTRANWETRVALKVQEAINQALHEPEGRWSESTTHRIHGAADRLLRYMLFADEAPLSAPVAGTSGFQQEFPRSGPKDHLGRSLRDFDLKRRLFRYPCSFLIYSEQFDALPRPVLDYLYGRLWRVLNGQDQEFAGMPPADRDAIREILVETKAGLPDYWRKGAGDSGRGDSAGKR